ncbi:efflux RND transporter periplasmic adaptor subunit [Thaumasiovibrio subtropicus]|uniref:efflux RND transporter periplasmic adaptor subunit n=1 Tax=Thaumasiovibrio subtropicus TaxID=1891207 RepID=UPI000B354E6C|nr:efflux RND transporter periplasmic adaptor subunit [Thaumasiovibrio subtropicus]
MKKHSFSLATVAIVLSTQAMAQGVPVKATITERGYYQPTLVATAKFEAQEHANLTPRVSGYLTHQRYLDGSHVEKGAVLFEIDATPYQLALDAAQAQKQQADAALAQATLTFNRVKELQGAGGATQADLDDATAALAMTRAGVALATAALNKAKDDLSHTQVRAPYAGTLGKARFSIGDMVSPATGSLIDIAQHDPINANFSVSHADFNQFRIDQAGAVTISLQERADAGELTFVDNKINANSGTIALAATFDNADNTLKPNQITRLTLESSDALEGVWIPQTAVTQDLTLQYVYIINAEQTAERREVSIRAQQGNQAFVTEGLTVGEQLITDGLMRVRPNMPVNVK